MTTTLYDCPTCCKLVRSLHTAEPTCRECGELLDSPTRDRDTAASNQGGCGCHDVTPGCWCVACWEAKSATR